MTPDEFERLVAQAVQRFNLRTAFDRRYVYLTCHAGGAPDEPGEGIRLQRPRAEERTLYLVQHDIRTHDSDLIKLFDRLRRDWSGFVSRPVRATNIVFGGSELSRDLAFTAGALALYDAGWRWRQEGVANMEFQPDETAVHPLALPFL